MPPDPRHRQRRPQQGPLWVLTWFAFLFIFAASAVAEIPDWDAAVRPLDEGVPQVAVMRLREILKRELAPADRKVVLTKLGEALLAAEEPEEALKILDDPLLQDVPVTMFWRAQALAALQRWPEALTLYQNVAAQPPSPVRNAAVFGQAEALRVSQRF